MPENKKIMNLYSEYKGIFYRYEAVDVEKCSFSGLWHLCTEPDTLDPSCSYGIFIADDKRLDECLEEFKEYVDQANKKPIYNAQI